MNLCVYENPKSNKMKLRIKYAKAETFILMDMNNEKFANSEYVANIIQFCRILGMMIMNEKIEWKLNALTVFSM